MEFVKRARGRHHSLAGLKTDQLVELVADEIQIAKAKAESVKMMVRTC